MSAAAARKEVADSETAKARRDCFRVARAMAKAKGATDILAIEEDLVARVVDHEATLRHVDEDERVAVADCASGHSRVQRADQLMREAEDLTRANRKAREGARPAIRDPVAREKTFLPTPPPHARDVARTDRVCEAAAPEAVVGAPSSPQIPPNALSPSLAID